MAEARAPHTDGEGSASSAEMAGRVAARLGETTEGEVRVVTTANRVRLVSARRAGGRLEVRIARPLLLLGPHVVEPIVDFALGRRGARKRLTTLFAALPRHTPTRARRVVLRPRGHAHDLEALAPAEARRAGVELSEVGLSWGERRPIRPGQRSIRLGSYVFSQKLVRVHPLLDRAEVPAWLVGFVLFHELLHHRFGVGESGSRRVVHPPELRAMERTHPHFDDAAVWERERLPRLMRAAARR